VARAKMLVAYTTMLLLQREPAEIGRKQQHLERFADMIIDLYAMESAVARARKVQQARGIEASAFDRDVVGVFVADAMERLGQNARVLFANDVTNGELGRHLATIARLTAHSPIGVLDARTRIAEKITEAGGMPA
jgi:hypothetical protein